MAQQVSAIPLMETPILSVGKTATGSMDHFSALVSENNEIRCVHAMGFYDVILDDTCGDPGTPADADQFSDDGYGVGSIVTFKCIKEGFALTDPSPLKCVTNGSGSDITSTWNQTTLPTCVGQLQK